MTPNHLSRRQFLGRLLVAGAAGAATAPVSVWRATGAGAETAPPAWDPGATYAEGELVTFAGRTWRAAARTARGQYPQGVGDGSPADRDLLLAQRSGFAAGVTGGASGATYVVTSTADTVTPGTLRYGLTRREPLWIVFDKALGPAATITLTSHLKPWRDKTVDGRGLDVTISGSQNLVLKGLGTANHIWAFVARTVSPTAAKFAVADAFGLHGMPPKSATATGFDLVWLHHVSFGQSGDGLLDAAEAGPEQSRLTVDWCRFGPHPDIDAWVYAYDTGTLGFNNSPSNGKTALCGADPQDGIAPDALRMTFHHNLFRGCVSRNIKIQRGRAHFFNNYVDRWGYVPLVTIPSDVVNHPDTRAYVEARQAGYRSNAGNPAHGTVGTEVGPDGELLAENNVYRPYAPGEEHLLSAALLGAGYLTEPWLVTAPKGAPITRYPVRPKPTVAEPVVRASGNWSPAGSLAGLNPDIHAEHVFAGVTFASDVSPYPALADGATRAAGPDWGGAAPYGYTLATADDRLLSDLDRGAGNTQAWLPA